MSDCTVTMDEIAPIALSTAFPLQRHLQAVADDGARCGGARRLIATMRSRLASPS